MKASAPWRVYYGNGEAIDGSICSVWDLPARNVQAIVQDHPQAGWHILTADFYWWIEDGEESGRWAYGDIFGLWDYLATNGRKRVLFGRTLQNDEFRAIFATAKAHRDQMNSAKSAFAVGERRPV